MTAAQPTTEQRDREAADWFARMSRTPIETEELTRFQRWSRDPANLAAYNQIEDISRAVRRMRDDPSMRAAAREALQRAPESRAAKYIGDWRVWGAGLAFAVVVGGFAITVRPLWAEAYSTRVGEISSIRLDDGSAVRLNTDSKLRVHFSNGVRRVELLRGQAYFEVAHDTARPFVVAAGPASVRAVGTQFDVRKMQTEVRVVLAQGRVAVNAGKAQQTEWTLAPGQGLVLGAQVANPRPIAVDVDAATSWRTGTLTFHNETLASAVDELNRYTRTKIVLDASAPRQLIVSGAFKAGDTDEFIAAASLLYGLRAKTSPNGDIVLSSAGGAS